MDTVQSKIDKYQKVLTEYITNLATEHNNALGNTMNYHALIDTNNNYFQLLIIGWNDDFYVHDVLIHLHIHAKTGNIWIYQNDTEIDIDIELARIANIPKKHFVLGFRPNYVREHSDYAVA